MIFATEVAGFICSNFVLNWLAQIKVSLDNFDKLNFAENLENLATLQCDARHLFLQDDRIYLPVKATKQK